jgi:predicted kinase
VYKYDSTVTYILSLLYFEVDVHPACLSIETREYNESMKLIIGIGVPGCGKTTFLKPLAERLGMVYINPDSIRQDLTGDASNHSREPDVWKTVYGRTSEALGKNGAVVDATSTRPQDRKRLIRIARSAGVTEIEAYWFNVPLQLCIERNSQRPRIVPEAVIREMHERLVSSPPVLEEGLTKIIERND